MASETTAAGNKITLQNTKTNQIKEIVSLSFPQSKFLYSFSSDSTDSNIFPMFSSTVPSAFRQLEAPSPKAVSEDRGGRSEVFFSAKFNAPSTYSVLITLENYNKLDKYKLVKYKTVCHVKWQLNSYVQ